MYYLLDIICFVCDGALHFAPVYVWIEPTPPIILLISVSMVSLVHSKESVYSWGFFVLDFTVIEM